MSASTWTWPSRISAEVRDATEQAAEIAVPAIDAWNANIRAAQAEAQASLAFRNLQSLMDQTGRTYDPHIRINDGDALSSMPAELQSLLEAQLMTQSAAVPTFIQRYTVESRQQLHTAAGECEPARQLDLQRWIAGERGWRENLLAVQLRKRGATSVSQTDRVADWRAEDQLQFRTRGLFGWHRWQRIGDRVSTASCSRIRLGLFRRAVVLQRLPARRRTRRFVSPRSPRNLRRTSRRPICSA